VILNKAHFLIFSPFFREVGKSRRVVYNLKEWLNEIDKLNGFDDVFTSVYPLDGTIDKIFFDIDDKDIEKAFEVAAKLYSWLRDNGFTVIPIATGKKGFQLHVLLEPLRYSNLCEKKKKELLANAAYYIIEKAGLTDEDGEPMSQIDTHVIGDVRRLCRVPNTLRPPENKSFCVFLPPNFDEMGIDDVVEYTKHLSLEYNYEINELKNLFDFPIVLTEKRKKKIARMDARRLRAPENIREYLKRLLRPCIFEELLRAEPYHFIRVAATIDLLRLGFTIDEIVKMYSLLGWTDFDYDKTRYQVEHIAEKGYSPYSCKKLRKLLGNRYCEKCV